MQILASEYRYILFLGIVQFLVLSMLLYRTFRGFKESEEKKNLFIAFLLYTLYIIFMVCYASIREGYLNLPNSDLTKIIGHLFKALFFMVFGYLILGAVIIEPLLKKILNTNTYIALALVIFFTAFVLLFERGSGVVLVSNLELAYELIVVTMQILILNVIYHSWRVSKLRKLELYMTAFLLFTVATLVHLFYVFYGMWEIHYSSMLLIYTIAVGILLYSTFEK
jgi:hypothetical protein